MHDNPRYEAYEEGSHRELPEGTIARGALALNPSAPRLDPAKASATPAATPAPGTPGAPATPAAAGAPAVPSTPTGEDGFPFVVTKAILDRGENRYNISCLPCHGVLGDGNGVIALRGIRRPPSYHDERLRQAPTSYYYDVITNGFGAMSNYADQLTPEDRWKVIAWIRVLQASQRMPKDRMKVRIGTAWRQCQPHRAEPIRWLPMGRPRHRRRRRRPSRFQGGEATDAIHG